MFASSNLLSLIHCLISVALDQILHGPRLVHQRRHSVSVCQTPIRPTEPELVKALTTAPQKKISVNLDGEAESPLSAISSFDSPSVGASHIPPVKFN